MYYSQKWRLPFLCRALGKVIGSFSAVAVQWSVNREHRLARRSTYVGNLESWAHHEVHVTDPRKHGLVHCMNIG